MVTYLHDFGLRGSPPILIENFLSKRKFHIRVRTSRSEYVDQKGLPPGRVLSITCFAFVINLITKQLDAGVCSTLYVQT